VKKPTAKPQGTKLQTAPQGGAAIGKIEPAKAAAAPAEPKKPFNPAKFFREVRQEANKITWTSRKETWITTVMVLLMVILASIFFFVVDGALGYLTSLLTKIGQG
jgi:preprotein translocase subunit SecE